jgi:hypothetical protein
VSPYRKRQGGEEMAKNKIWGKSPKIRKKHKFGGIGVKQSSI